MKRFCTEYVAEDGSHWSGPLILADSLEMAQALNVCLLGPGGERLSIIGEEVMTLPAVGVSLSVSVGIRH